MASLIATSSAMLLAAPSPLDDEDFLLFLADSLESENEEQTVDALTMVEGTLESTQAKNEINPQQEDKNEQ